jgi:hypothetical protein
MPTPAEGIQSQLRNIERTYGRSIDELVADVSESGLTKHPEVVAMLKLRYGMTHGAAHRVSLVARERLAGPQSQAPAAVSESVRGLYDQVAQAVTALGGDIELAPKKGYVSLRRRKQFGMLQAGARGCEPRPRPARRRARRPPGVGGRMERAVHAPRAHRVQRRAR